MPSSDAATTQRRIGRYLLQEEVGRGGMGVVYAALDEGLGRRVALKLLRTGGPGEDAVAGDRFAQEMQIAISLEHPNVVPVYETGTEEGVRYIAMRLVDGEDMGAVIRREGALEPGRVARLGRQIASALDAAHARGLVHRDVKPGNVLLTGTGDEEHAYLTDFGLTRDADGGITQTGQWIGTVDYAAPEQIDAAPLTARTDVYALGCVIFHALTGHLPFTGSFAAKATGHATRPLPSVGLPGELGTQVDKVLAIATAKDPLRRHASAGALARSLARVITAGSDDLTQQTTAMPVILPDDDEPPTALDATEATSVQAREPRPALADVPQRERARARPAVATPVTAGAGAAGAAAAASAPPAGRPPRPRPQDTGPEGGRRSWLVVASILATLLVVGALVALVSGGGGDGGDGSSSQAKDSGTTSGKTTAKTPSTGSTASSTPTSTATAAPEPTAPAPAPKAIPTELYTSPAGGYSAQVPAGDGWVNQGESNQNGIIRTVLSGPDGQRMWIDATPSIAPGFGREGRTVTETRTISGPLGDIVGYRFTGVPTEFCGGGCVDYQLDRGGRGFAVLAGPTPSARLAARKTILSLQETAPPAQPQTPAAQDPAALAPAARGGKAGKAGKRSKEDD